MTERKPTDGGEESKPPATDDEKTRRTFLGAAAALGALPVATGTVSAEEADREIVDDARGRRYADGDYGTSTVSEDTYADVEVGARTDATIKIHRASSGVDLRVSTDGVRFLLSLTPEECRALRDELRYAEAQIPDVSGGVGGD